jgi:tetratricopeptide (TPR) repeat protein
LARIAKSAKDKGHREQAAARVQDEAVLAEVANTDPEASVRAQAGKRLNPVRWKDLLAVLNAKPPAVAAANPAQLAELAGKAIDGMVRTAAVLRLTDTDALAKIAAQDCEPSVRAEAGRRISVLELEKRVAQGQATRGELRDLGLAYQSEDPKKSIRYCTDAIGDGAWLQALPWQERMALFEGRAAAYLATRQFDSAMDDLERAIEECKEPGLEYQALRKRSACYKELGMEEQAQADRAAAAKAEQQYRANRAR